MFTLPSRRAASLVAIAATLLATGCLTPPPKALMVDGKPVPVAVTPPKPQTMKAMDAWTAARAMGIGINIGNTLDNTSTWETGWGQPLITRELILGFSAAGFNTVRLPVAWDTYAHGGQIDADKFNRVNEVVDWILEAGMFCILNIHWDGGWIDSSWKEHYTDTYATFSPVADKKFRSYWTQISTFFAGKGERLIFESLNEETKFDNEGSPEKAYATLTRVNQIFIDTVRKTGGNNANRLLLVTGYGTDITKTCDPLYQLPVDPTPHRMLLSVHYYTPWPFCGMTEDADWGKMALTWGDGKDKTELYHLFGTMSDYSLKHDTPVVIGEFGVTEKKESESRARYLSAVFETALAQKMVPVLWDTGHDFSRADPYVPSGDLQKALDHLKSLAPKGTATPAAAKAN